MEKVAERLLTYVKIDTQSDENSPTCPSTEKQLNLARLLKEECEQMGCTEVKLDEHGYVYATLEANCDVECPTIGFIAHMDTAPDFSGANVNPRIIENYDGNDIVLNESMTLRVADYPVLAKSKGQDLMVTDGTTLLGADDKAGIAAIMEAFHQLHQSNQPHGKIKLAFTPDEEIGRGADLFDVKGFGCDFAYTLDGGDVSGIANETFNAASAQVTIIGESIHPGSAKDKMINAATVAMFFHNCLPTELVPEKTEGKQGFIHLHGMSGSVEKAELHYILREHDSAKLEEMKQLMHQAAEITNHHYGKEAVQVTIEDSYRNMLEVLQEHPHVTKLAQQALMQLGIEPMMESVRGGTDGARLSFEGLPCPNLGAGGENFHGPYEYCNLTQLSQAVQLILKIVELNTNGGAQ